MPALTVTPQDKALSTAARAELTTMFNEGITGGGSIAGPLAGVSLPSLMMDTYEMTVLAVIRLFKRAANGASETGTPPPYPARVPQYLKAAMPNPVDYEGSVIYVKDATGGEVLAFSDGTSWLRCTDRTLVN